MGLPPPICSAWSVSPQGICSAWSVSPLHTSSAWLLSSVWLDCSVGLPPPICSAWSVSPQGICSAWPVSPLHTSSARLLCSAWSLSGLVVLASTICSAWSFPPFCSAWPMNLLMSVCANLCFFGAGVSESCSCCCCCLLFSCWFFSEACPDGASSHSGSQLLQVSEYLFWPVFLLFGGGFVCWLLVFLFLFLVFLISLILFSKSSSFSLASSSTFSYFLNSLSPSLVLNLGSEHLLYSLLEFSRLWWVFCWMQTDSMICLSKEVLVNLITSIPNFIPPSSSPSCLSRACLSMWLDGFNCFMSFWCSFALSKQLLLLSPMYLCSFMFLMFSCLFFWSSPASSTILASSLSLHVMQ